MSLLAVWTLAAFFAAAEVPAAPPAEAGAEVGAGANVVLVMWDGIHRQEFLGNRPDGSLSAADQNEVLPRFWSSLAAQGAVYGDEALGAG